MRSFRKNRIKNLIIINHSSSVAATAGILNKAQVPKWIELLHSELIFTVDRRKIISLQINKTTTDQIKMREVKTD